MLKITLGKTASMQDVADWIRGNRCIDTYRAVARAPKLWDDRPLSDLPADAASFEARFPRDGFEPLRHKSESAYRAWRSKVLSAIHAFEDRNKAAGAQVQRPSPAKEAWSELKRRVQPHTENEGPFKSQDLLPVVALSNIAAQHGLCPRDLTAAGLARLEPLLAGYERKQVKNALRMLNTLRNHVRLDDLLPTDPFPDEPWSPGPKPNNLPPEMEAAIDGWLEKASGKKVDPVYGRISGGNSEGDWKVKLCAMRKYVSTAISSGTVEPTCTDFSKIFSQETCIAVLRKWAESEDLIPRTIWTYIDRCRVVAARNGVDTQWYPALQDAVELLKEGRRASKEMSPRAKKFCRSVLENEPLRTRLLTMHSRARKAAQEILDRAAAAGRPLRKREVERVRQLGSVAAFSAIETVAAPFRIDNALGTVFRGDIGRTLFLPSPGSNFARFIYPGMLTKNNEQLEVPLVEDRRHGLDTVLWYIRVVRPLFAHHEKNNFLFPSVQKPRASMTIAVFRRWFEVVTRQIGLRMCPHNFRHGLASLLIRQRPGEYDDIAALLGNTPETVIRFYAWINKRSRVEAAQSRLLDLCDAA